MTFVPDPVDLCLDSDGNPVSAPIKRFGGLTYSVTADNAQGAAPPLTGRPFRTTSFRPKGSYMTAKLEFSFFGLTTDEETAWRAAFAGGQVVFISLNIDGTTTTEQLSIRLCPASVAVAAFRFKEAVIELKNDSLALISAGFALVRAIFSRVVQPLTRKNHEEGSLVHAEAPKRLE